MRHNEKCIITGEKTKSVFLGIPREYECEPFLCKFQGMIFSSYSELSKAFMEYVDSVKNITDSIQGFDIYDADDLADMVNREETGFLNQWLANVSYIEQEYDIVNEDANG